MKSKEDSAVKAFDNPVVFNVEEENFESFSPPKPTPDNDVSSWKFISYILIKERLTVMLFYSQTTY